MKWVSSQIMNATTKIIGIWTEYRYSVSETLFDLISAIDREGFNPVFMMADSGARGSKEQIRQLGGMRGLMAKPSGTR